jgi:hypothetical protein
MLALGGRTQSLFSHRWQKLARRDVILSTSQRATRCGGTKINIHLTWSLDREHVFGIKRGIMGSIKAVVSFGIAFSSLLWKFVHAMASGNFRPT